MKRPSRLAWFAFDVDAFMDDPRTQGLTNTERAYWALLLIKSFRQGGKVNTRPEVVAEQIGCKIKDAKLLLAYLMEHHLLVPTGKVYEAFSPRMKAEHDKAIAAYEQRASAGKTRAETASRDVKGRVI